MPQTKCPTEKGGRSLRWGAGYRTGRARVETNEEAARVKTEPVGARAEPTAELRKGGAMVEPFQAEPGILQTETEPN